MSKYRVKNCPAYIHRPLSTHDRVCLLGDKVKPNHKELYVYCQDCTDCVMKQIVEKCKKEIRVYRDTLLPNDGTNTLHFGRQSFAYDILQMLDIEGINLKIKRSECPYNGIDCAWCGEDCE